MSRLLWLIMWVLITVHIRYAFWALEPPVFNFVLIMRFPNLCQALFLLVLSEAICPAQKATLKQVTVNIGSNPTNARLAIYVPATAVILPARVWRKRRNIFRRNEICNANTHGFIVPFPSAPDPHDMLGCPFIRDFDV